MMNDFNNIDGIKAYVYGEHTLGLIRKPSLTNTMTFECLNGLGSRGGMSNIDSPRLVSPSEVRPATLADFETFKVRHHASYLIEASGNQS